MAPTFRILDEQFIKLTNLLSYKSAHFLGDGKYANNTVVKLCKKYGFNLISKLQNNASLILLNTQVKVKLNLKSMAKNLIMII